MYLHNEFHCEQLSCIMLLTLARSLVLKRHAMIANIRCLCLTVRVLKRQLVAFIRRLSIDTSPLAAVVVNFRLDMYMYLYMYM